MVSNVPDGSAVLQHLGEESAGVSLEAAERCVRRATALARAHTNGRGFSARGDVVASELAELIVRSAARALLNPAYPLRFSEEPFTGRPGSFTDWSQAEMDVLGEIRSATRGAAPD